MTKNSEDTYKVACDLQKRKDHPAAVRLLRELVTVAPADARYWVALGVTLIELRHWAEAVRALSRGVALKPHYAEADARMFLAEAYVGAGNVNAAVQQWQVVVSMEPAYPSREAPMQEASRLLTAHGAQPTVPADGLAAPSGRQGRG